MADEDDPTQADHLEVSDEDAERLLADPADERRPRATRDAADADDVDTDDADSGDGDDDGLRQQGRRALEAMKEQRKAARAQRDKAVKEANDLRRELETLKGGNKSELRRLIEERDSLREQLGEVSSTQKRRDIADQLAPEHATRKQVALVAKYLSGSTDEELESSAEELFGQFAPAPLAKTAPTASRPKERLRAGTADPEEDDEETDGRKLAAMISQRR